MNVAAILSPRQATTPIDPAYAAEDNRPKLFAITGTFISVAILAVVLRVYVRMRIIKTLGADDVMMVAALVIP